MRLAQRTSRRSELAGFTLFELIVAMGVLLLAAGIVWPVVLSFYQRTALIDAGQTVRETLAASRLSAIDRGIQYLFLYEPAGRLFVMLPAEGVERAGEQVAQTTSDVEVRSGELPEGFQFIDVASSGAGSIKLTTEMIGGAANADKLAGARWSEPAVFFPDGTGSSLSFEVEDDQSQYISVSVRGVTGAATVSKILSREEGR